MTANLAGPKGYGFEKRQHVAERVFLDCPADIVGFQECTPYAWSLLERASLELIETPKLMQNFMGQEEETYFNPIAVNPERFRVLEHGNRWLSESGEPVPSWGAETIRALSLALLAEHGSDRKLLVLNAQLDNKSACARAKAVEQVILPLIETYRIKEDLALPVLLLADANVNIASSNPRWHEPEMRRPYELMEDAGFRDAWLETNPRRLMRPRTFHHYQGATCGDDEWGTVDPDWVFALNIKIENCTPVEDNYGGVWPSDHYWGLAFLQWES